MTFDKLIGKTIAKVDEAEYSLLGDDDDRMVITVYRFTCTDGDVIFYAAGDESSDDCYTWVFEVQGGKINDDGRWIKEFGGEKR